MNIEFRSAHVAKDAVHYIAEIWNSENVVITYRKE